MNPPSTAAPQPLGPDEEEHLLPRAQAWLDGAARAAVRQAIAAGRFQEALAILRRAMRRVQDEQERPVQT